MTDPTHAARVAEIESVMEDLIAKPEPQDRFGTSPGKVGLVDVKTLDILTQALQTLQANNGAPISLPKIMMEEISALKPFADAETARAAYEVFKLVGGF